MYFTITLGTFMAPSFDCTMEAGSKLVMFIALSESISSSHLGLLLLVSELVLRLRFLPLILFSLGGPEPISRGKRKEKLLRAA